MSDESVRKKSLEIDDDQVSTLLEDAFDAHTVIRMDPTLTPHLQPPQSLPGPPRAQAQEPIDKTMVMSRKEVKSSLEDAFDARTMVAPRVNPLRIPEPEQRPEPEELTEVQVAKPVAKSHDDDEQASTEWGFQSDKTNPGIPAKRKFALPRNAVFGIAGGLAVLVLIFIFGGRSKTEVDAPVEAPKRATAAVPAPEPSMPSVEAILMQYDQAYAKTQGHALGQTRQENSHNQ